MAYKFLSHSLKKVLSSKTSRNFFWRALQTFLKQSFSLFVYYYSAYELSPEIFGHLVIILATVSLIILFCDFGISTAASKFVAEFAATNNLKKIDEMAFTLVTFLSALILGVLIIIELSKRFLGDWEVYIENIGLLKVYILFLPLTSVLDGIWVGQKKFKELAIINLLVWLLLIPTSHFLISRQGLLGVFTSLNAYAVSLFILFAISKRKISFRFDNTILRKTISYSLYIGFAGLSYYLYTRADIFVLAYFEFEAEIGYYEIINRLFMLIIVPATILAQVLAPENTMLITHGSFKKFRKRFYTIITAALIIGILVALTIKFILPTAIKSFFTEYYNQDFLMILNILLFILPLKFAGVTSSIAFITPAGLAKIATYITLIFGLFNIVLDYIFVKYLGFIGVFWVTLIVHNAANICQLMIFSNCLRGNLNLIKRK